MAIFDLEHATGLEFADPDVCVVGAGAAGIVLAAELVHQGKRVLLLEGGGRTLEDKSQALYDSHVVGLGHQGIHNGRFRALGGSTTKWAGQILELDASDFEARDWVPGSGWPFSKSELAPYYQRALVAEGMSGVELGDEEVWRAVGGDASVRSGDVASYLSRWTPDPDFTRVHRETLEASAELGVYLHANATQLVLDDGGRRVRAVRCRTLDGAETEFTAAAFVLCLGGIETVRFLLQPQHASPWRGHPFLGRHFQDHVVARCGVIDQRDRRAFQDVFANVYLDGWKYQPWLGLSPAARRREQLLSASSVMRFSDDDEDTLARLKATSKDLFRGRIGAVGARDAAHMAAHLPLLAKHAWRLRRAGRSYHPANAGVQLEVWCEQSPLGDSAIRLSSDRDALGQFKAELDWRVSEIELRTLAGHSRAVARALAQLGLGTVTFDPDLLAGNDSFRARCVDSNHHMGGARMARDSALGVVDTELRLHATENAYVCSSAVFPSSGCSNPTHTLLALALRLADTLAADAAG